MPITSHSFNLPLVGTRAMWFFNPGILYRAGCVVASLDIITPWSSQNMVMLKMPASRHVRDTCAVMHAGSLTRGGGENVPGIPGACTSRILRIWQEAHEWTVGWTVGWVMIHTILQTSTLCLNEHCNYYSLAFHFHNAVQSVLYCLDE